MKRTITTTLLAIVLGLAIVFTGCAGFQLTDTQEIIVTKLARIAGITLGLDQPGEIDKALSYINYVQNLDNGSLRQSAISTGIKYIYETYGKTSKTVILVAEVVDLLNTALPENIVPGLSPDQDETVLNEFNMKLLNLALDAFKQGLILAK